MLRFLRALCGQVWNGLSVLFTGGRFGSSVPGEHSYHYSKAQEQRRKDFREFGAHPCKICSTSIPANKLYCGACYRNYIR